MLSAKRDFTKLAAAILFSIGATGCSGQSAPGCSAPGVKESLLDRMRSDPNMQILSLYYDFALIDIRTERIDKTGATVCSTSGRFDLKPLSKEALDDLRKLKQSPGPVQETITLPLRFHYDVFRTDEGKVVVQTH